ncbi:hypothetical protein [Bacteroides ihuae]|uniref:hypothetical protein n=1 Tax=Bacteroides ihuae TaxID=1852362 RepID=UPI0008DABA97|nr:hypothetical protein [Bacteroides ihuae]
MEKKNTESLLSYKFFRGSCAWIILILGVIGYIYAYSLLSEGLIKEVLIKVSDVLVIGVIVGYLSNAAQFLGIFKKDLQEIIYSERFLNKQNDIVKIWEAVTKAMFKSKFPVMSKDLFPLIKKIYLPDDEVSYYDNYRVITDIEWVNDEKRFVIVKDTISFDLIAENTSAFSIPFRTWINIEGLSKDEYYSNVICKVDDQKISLDISEKTKDDNTYIQECKITLKGKNKYEITQQREKKYCFEHDYDLSFRAKYIVRNLSVTLNHPIDLSVSFICRGTPDDFKLVKKSKGSVEYSYKGLILPRQGYIFALHK